MWLFPHFSLEFHELFFIHFISALLNLQNAQTKKDDVMEPLPDDIVGRIEAESPEQIKQW